MDRSEYRKAIARSAASLGEFAVLAVLAWTVKEVPDLRSEACLAFGYVANSLFTRRNAAITARAAAENVFERMSQRPPRLHHREPPDDQPPPPPPTGFTGAPRPPSPSGNTWPPIEEEAASIVRKPHRYEGALGVVVLAAAACGPAQPVQPLDEYEITYGAELHACVVNATTRKASHECRDEVMQRWAPTIARHRAHLDAGPLPLRDAT